MEARPNLNVNIPGFGSVGRLDQTSESVRVRPIAWAATRHGDGPARCKFKAERPSES